MQEKFKEKLLHCVFNPLKLLIKIYSTEKSDQHIIKYNT